MLKLGTARHHQGLLRGIDNVDDIGCFALTELGFGEHQQCRKLHEEKTSTSCGSTAAYASQLVPMLSQGHGHPLVCIHDFVQATMRWRCRRLPPGRPGPL